MYNVVNMVIRGSLVFGYLQVQKSELLVREYEAYKAVYCSLCRQMGRDYSLLSRFSLSYDCTFYAMLLMSLSRGCKGFEDGRCRFNPLKKCKYATDEADCLARAAAFSVISAYYKLSDDISDEKFFKRILARLLRPFFGRWRKKAAARYPRLDQAVAEMMTMQAEAEQKDGVSLDEAAHPTAHMTGTVFSLDTDDEMLRRVLYEFGYHIGRWIYLIDAADDLEKDAERGGFNPFKDIDADRLVQYETEVLNQSLARAYEAYNLLTLIDFKGILDNMLLYGFPAKQNQVIDKDPEEKDEQKSI